MKTASKLLLCLPLCLLLVWFLADADVVRQAATEALALCTRSVIPALFPFLTVSSLLVSLGLGQDLSPYFAGLMTSLYRLPGTAGSAFLLGLVAGYPVGPRTAAELYQSGLLTRDEAERLLGFCNNSNPVFLISVLGSGVFGSTRTGLWLWLIHIASALLTGLLFRGTRISSSRFIPRSSDAGSLSFSTLFVGAVKNTASTLLSVCAFVTFFYILSSPLSAVPRPFGSLLTGSLELFSLTPRLTDDRSGFVISSFCAGWGGVSVLCQTAAVLEGSGLSLRPCVVGKLTQGALSALLAFLLSSYILN